MLKLPVRENAHWKTKLRRIDFLGAIVLVGAVLGFLLGLDRGSNVSWKLPLTIASLGVSVVLFVVFILVEIYLAAEPFAPGHIIFDRTFFSLYCCNFFSFGGWLAALFYIPLYFQAVDGVSATIAGLRLLPSILAGVTGSLFAGFVMKWTGKYYWLTVAGYTSLTAGCLIIYLFSGGLVASTVPMIIGMVMSAFGNGIGVTTTLIGLSEYLVIHCLSYFLTNLSRSFKFHLGRSGCGDRLLLSLPFLGLGYWTVSVCERCPATSEGAATI
jgi:MFS family permease